MDRTFVERIAELVQLHANAKQVYGDPVERDGTTMLRRRLRFGDFKDAFGFATRIALVAEEEGHHPDMEIGWGKVVVSLTTHSSGGLTPNDFIMAAKVDRLAAGIGLKEG